MWPQAPATSELWEQGSPLPDLDERQIASATWKLKIKGCKAACSASSKPEARPSEQPHLTASSKHFPNSFLILLNQHFDMDHYYKEGSITAKQNPWQRTCFLKHSIYRWLVRSLNIQVIPPVHLSSLYISGTIHQNPPVCMWGKKKITSWWEPLKHQPLLGCTTPLILVNLSGKS